MTEPVIPADLLDLARPFAEAGWSRADFYHALNYPPDGVEPVWGNPVRREVAEARLALWLDGGEPTLSPSQRRARTNAAMWRDQQVRREMLAEIARVALPDPSSAAARARRILAEASPGAAKVLARPPQKQETRNDPERWRRLDEAAAAAIAVGARSEAGMPAAVEPVGEDPVVVAREESLRRARARARWERQRKGN
ncbi:hypothetical protein AB0C10_16290 [Microbispora amethystogenes]|uniref:hypothetical protein n=1 Tax=Microbispora amethystogenes TaxID=1427754 RepID=UPI0033E5DE48